MSESCPYCGQTIKIGQVALTPREKSRVNWAGNGGRPNIIEAQCVKAAGLYFEVNDWFSLWDRSVGVSENIDIMRRHGNGYKGGPTMKEIHATDAAQCP